MSDSRPEKRKDFGAAYAAMGVGLALVVASVLVGITAGVPAAAFPFLIPAFACLSWGFSQVKQQQHALPKPANGERELLSTIRDKGGGITPADDRVVRPAQREQQRLGWLQFSSPGLLATRS